MVVLVVCHAIVLDLMVTRKSRTSICSYRITSSQLFFCRLMEMEGDRFLTDILLSGDGRGVAGLDDLSIPITQNTHSMQEVQQVEVEVQQSRSTKGSKRT